MNSKLTIKDIARIAGVSTATVSCVINNTRPVSKKLSDRVNKVIKKYNYRTNIHAGSLRSKVTKLIGMIIPDIANPIFSFFSKKIENLFRDRGYSLIICDSERHIENDLEYINILYQRNIDGLIFFPSKENDRRYEILNKFTIPTVIIERRLKNIKADTILNDDYKSFLDLIDYLVNLGHKRIAYINIQKGFYQSSQRMKGYLDGLKKNKIKFDGNLIVCGDGFIYKDGYHAMQELLKIENRPTAVIAFLDVLAIGAVRAIKDYKLKIPDDISVVGVDNILIDNFLETTLTSLSGQKGKIAEIAFDLLLNRINGDKSKSKNIVLPRKLKIRESTGPITCLS